MQQPVMTLRLFFVISKHGYYVEAGSSHEAEDGEFRLE